MSEEPAAGRLHHPALGGAGRGTVGLDSPRLTDRARLAVLLQGLALLSHLRAAGWRLPRGWEGARLGPGPALAGLTAAPGAEPARELAGALAFALFGGEAGLAGRGQSRRLAREVLLLLDQPLAPFDPDRAVAYLLAGGAFLWSAAMAPARIALLAAVPRTGGWELRVAGPPSLGREVRRRCGADLTAARRLLAGEEAQRWLRGASRGARRPAPVGPAVDSERRGAFLGRRRLTPDAAAAAWRRLGLERRGNGDLTGAWRAWRHAFRLEWGHGGFPAACRDLVELACLLARRGEVGVAAAFLDRLHNAGAPAGSGGRLALVRARIELARGRPDLALERLPASAGGEGDEERRVLAARALGWLGRAAEAAQVLAAGEPQAVARHLEPEERPACWALAGRPAEARQAASRAGSAGGAWRAALAGEAIPSLLGVAAAVGGYRAARLVVDLELAAGGVPAAWRRRAAALLRRVGATPLAERLEARMAGPWPRLARCLGTGESALDLAELFRAAGYPEVRLSWREGPVERLVVPGEGGVEELSAPVGDRRLVLRAARMDAALAALFALACREAPRCDREAATGPEPPPAPSRPRGWQPASERAPGRLATAASRYGAGAAHPGIPAVGSGWSLALRAPQPAGACAGGGDLVGTSPALCEALERLSCLACGEIPVLLWGETGTGKELAARRFHAQSARRAGPLLPLNCAALSESLLLSDLFGHVRGAFTGADRDRAGVFEAAQGGTVLLDEVGDLPAAAQGMLLRVLQEREIRRLGESRPRRVDVRVVAATHRDLDRLVAKGAFRADLLYRLRVGRVRLPPLRERGEDVLLLAEHFLARAAGPRGARLSPACRERLLGHSWPGNVRELEGVIAVAVALSGGGVVRACHLELPAPAPPPAGGYHQEVLALRRRLVEDALVRAAGNRAHAARQLGLSRQALCYLVRQLGIA